jgi:hypothetical protein
MLHLCVENGNPNSIAGSAGGPYNPHPQSFPFPNSGVPHTSCACPGLKLVVFVECPECSLKVRSIAPGQVCMGPPFLISWYLYGAPQPAIHFLDSFAEEKGFAPQYPFGYSGFQRLSLC